MAPQLQAPAVSSSLPQEGQEEPGCALTNHHMLLHHHPITFVLLSRSPPTREAPALLQHSLSKAVGSRQDFSSQHFPQGNFQINSYSNTGGRHHSTVLRNLEKPFLSKESLPCCAHLPPGTTVRSHIPAQPRHMQRCCTKTLPYSELLSGKHGCRPRETLALFWKREGDQP